MVWCSCWRTVCDGSWEFRFRFGIFSSALSKSLLNKMVFRVHHVDCRLLFLNVAQELSKCSSLLDMLLTIWFYPIPFPLQMKNTSITLASICNFLLPSPNQRYILVLNKGSPFLLFFFIFCLSIFFVLLCFSRCINCSSCLDFSWMLTYNLKWGCIAVDVVLFIYCES